MPASVPIVNLLDTHCEPTDEQLAALMRCVRDEAVQKASIANTRINIILQAQVNTSWKMHEKQCHNASQEDAGHG